MAKIVTILVTQHADVNASAFGNPPRATSLMDIVELLLRHGSRSPYIDSLRFLSTDVKLEYHYLLQRTDTDQPRPARPCPCWSGKLLSEYHDTGDEIPYPRRLSLRMREVQDIQERAASTEE